MATWSPSYPMSFRINSDAANWLPSAPAMPQFDTLQNTHQSHPSFGHLMLLVFGAVMEVVCVALPGYIIARMGQFDAEKQKFLANLNVMIFTPCLIFTKLASQLNAEKLADLGVIPVIFCVQTAVSYLVSVGVSKAFRFKKRPANFVTAMGVFGNSNSLPISLVMSLAQTLKGLHWDKIPGDNDDEVAARGILYLMIFQQLGQLVRWSWGYHVLLKPKDKYDDYQEERIEEGRRAEIPYTDEAPPGAGGVLIPGLDGGLSEDATEDSDGSEVYEPAGRTPIAGTSTASPNDSDDEDYKKRNKNSASSPSKKRAAGANGVDGSNDPFGATVDPNSEIASFPRMRDGSEPEIPDGIRGHFVRAKLSVSQTIASIKQKTVNASYRTYSSLPQPAQTVLAGLWGAWLRVYGFLWEFMNPPLWAMLIAVTVASIPDLQRLFFEDDSFMRTSVTRAVESSAGIAVPLILVVLGANLARNTQNTATVDAEEKEIGTKLLVASLISRMVLPTLIMAPIIALFAKYVPVSILDDPIFVIVCFLLNGAPSALQLAQICQLNEVFEGVMSKILFQSYVIWILPSTLILVMLALETVEWASAV